MPLKHPFASWRKLNATQRRHVQLGAGGIALSWALAAVMAYSNTIVPGNVTRLADSTPTIQQAPKVNTEMAVIRLKP